MRRRQNINQPFTREPYTPYLDSKFGLNPNMEGEGVDPLLLFGWRGGEEGRRAGPLARLPPCPHPPAPAPPGFTFLEKTTALGVSIRKANLNLNPNKGEDGPPLLNWIQTYI